MAFTLADMRTRIRDAIDITHSEFASDAELTRRINVANSRLHNLFVSKYEDYTITTATVPLVAGTNTYNLPADFFKERTVSLTSGGETALISRFGLREYNWRRSGTGSMGYTTAGSLLYLAPAPVSSTDTVQLVYVPQCAALVDDEDELPAFYPYGVEDLITWDVAIDVAIKEESDPRPFWQRRTELAVELEGILANRSVSTPRTVVDMESVGADAW